MFNYNRFRYFQNNLKFNNHIQTITAEAYMLGFIKRVIYDFKNINSINYLYT